MTNEEIHYDVAVEDMDCECGKPITAGAWVAWDHEATAWIHAACVESEFDYRASAIAYFKSQGMNDREAYNAVEGLYAAEQMEIEQ